MNKIQTLLTKKPSELTPSEKTTLEIYVNFNPNLTGEERIDIRKKFNIGQTERTIVKYKWYV